MSQCPKIWQGSLRKPSLSLGCFMCWTQSCCHRSNIVQQCASPLIRIACLLTCEAAAPATIWLFMLCLLPFVHHKPTRNLTCEAISRICIMIKKTKFLIKPPGQFLPLFTAVSFWLKPLILAACCAIKIHFSSFHFIFLLRLNKQPHIALHESCKIKICVNSRECLF